MKKMRVGSYRGGRKKHIVIFFYCHLYVTYHIDEDPLLRVDGLLIEEKGTASVTVAGEIGCKGCKPLEYVKAST